MSGAAPHSRRLAWALLAGYFVSLTLGLVLLGYARRATIAALDTPEARAQWQRWKSDETARQQRGEGPVRRRAPRSDEPPGLVLMRDSFPGIVIGSVAIGSFLYGCLAWVTLEMTRRKQAVR